MILEVNPVAGRKNGIAVNPHFSEGFDCGGGSRHIYWVALSELPEQY
jgi:hypothetical protein